MRRYHNPEKRRTFSFNRQAKLTSELLRKYRAKYPYRLVRDKQFSPKPNEVVGLTGDYASVPTSGGVEWFFMTDEDRQRFIKLYGGTPI